MNDAARAVLGLVGGAVLGWAAQSLTMTGRVDALEAALPRIELRLDELVRSLQAQASSGRAAPASR